jgi:hypothetical protein
MFERPHWVYVIREENGPVKIGMATEPSWRLSSLQGGNSRKLKLVQAYRTRNKRDSLVIERATQTALSEFWIINEWFDVAPDVAVKELAYQLAQLYERGVQG